MSIRTECMISLKESDFIMATCSKCKSEIRIQAGKKVLEKCVACGERYTPAQLYALTQLNNALAELKEDKEVGDIKIIKIENM